MPNDHHNADYCKILGIETTATAAEVKKAYRTLAKEFHPDKLQALSVAMRELAEEKFKEINEAYHVLTGTTGTQPNRGTSSPGQAQGKPQNEKSRSPRVQDLVRKADALIRSGQYPPAIALLKRAARLDEGNVQIQARLGDAKREWGQTLLRRNYR